LREKKKLREDIDLIKEAVKQNVDALEFVSSEIEKELRANKEFIREVLIQYPKIINSSFFFKDFPKNQLKLIMLFWNPSRVKRCNELFFYFVIFFLLN